MCKQIVDCLNTTGEHGRQVERSCVNATASPIHSVHQQPEGLGEQHVPQGVAYGAQENCQQNHPPSRLSDQVNPFKQTPQDDWRWKQDRQRGANPNIRNHAERNGERESGDTSGWGPFMRNGHMQD
jgi:hypothetical protein